MPQTNIHRLQSAHYGRAFSGLSARIYEDFEPSAILRVWFFSETTEFDSVSALFRQ